MDLSVMESEGWCLVLVLLGLWGTHFTIWASVSQCQNQKWDRGASRPFLELRSHPLAEDRG